MFRWLNLTMRHIQVTLAHYQSARNLRHDACYMLIAHSHSWGDFSKIVLLFIIKLSSQVVELDDETYSKYTGRLPKCKRPVSWFLSTNAPQFLLKKHLQCFSKYTPTRAKVHVVCTVVCPGNWNNAQLDNLFNIKRTKIYSISMCYYPSPGVVVDHVLKL